MAKRTKFQLKKAAIKRAAQYFENLSGGMATVISAYLIAVSTKFVTLEGYTVVAAYLGTSSLVLLALYKFLSFFEAEGDMKQKNPMASLFTLGFMGGLLTYMFILASIQPWLAITALASLCIALLPFLTAFEKKS